MSRRNRLAPGVAAATCLIAFAPASAVERDGGCARVHASRSLASDSIGLRLENDIAQLVAARAVAAWSGCAGYGDSFPAFTAGHTSMRTIQVHFEEAHGAGVCGVLRGGTITIFAFAKLPSGRLATCDPEATLTHELGHVLGLLDAPATPACLDHVMASGPASGPDLRRVGDEECAAVAAKWERPPASPPRGDVLALLPPSDGGASSQK